MKQQEVSVRKIGNHKKRNWNILLILIIVNLVWKQKKNGEGKKKDEERYVCVIRYLYSLKIK